MAMIKSVWGFRYFIISSVKTEIKARIARSKIGWAWVIINPLAQAAMLALVLSRLMRAKFPGIDNQYAYALYLLAGTMGWALFSEVLTRSVTVFCDNANVLKKVKFPKICLPSIVICSALFNHCLLLLCTIVIFLFLNNLPTIDFCWLPIVISINLFFATGLGLLLGIINVFIRDIGQSMPIILQFWFWATPIVYHPDMLPKPLFHLMKLNPMYYIIQGYQSSLVYHTSPPMRGTFLIALMSLSLLLMALFLFKRAGSDIIDEL